MMSAASMRPIPVARRYPRKAGGRWGTGTATSITPENRKYASFTCAPGHMEPIKRMASSRDSAASLNLNPKMDACGVRSISYTVIMT